MDYTDVEYDHVAVIVEFEFTDGIPPDLQQQVFNKLQGINPAGIVVETQRARKITRRQANAQDA